jgi:integrase
MAFEKKLPVHSRSSGFSPMRSSSGRRFLSRFRLYFDDDDCRDMRMPSRQARILTPEQADGLLFWAARSRHPLRNRLVVLLSVKAGLRAAEIAKLSWDMVLDAEGNVGTSIALHDRIAEKRGGRVIPMNAELKESMIALHSVSIVGRSAAVIQSECGGPMTPFSIVVVWPRF